MKYIFWKWCSIYWKLHEPRNDLQFLHERMESAKVANLVANLHDKTKYAIIHIKNLKQALNNGLVLKKVLRVIKNLIKMLD